MRAKFYLMKSLFVSGLVFSSVGSLSAWAEDISVAPVRPSGSDRPVERISVQTLRTMRDPFKRLGMDLPDAHEDKAKSELESLPVSEFKMVGVLTGPYKTRALVRSPAGNVYTVSDGTRIGSQNGYVRKVLQDRIIVNEVLQDVLGERELVTSELKLTSKGVEKGVSSVQSVLTSSASPKKAEGSEAQSKDGAKDGSNSDASSKAVEIKGSSPAAAATPAATTAAPAATTGSSYNLAVPAPMALPQANGIQKTAGSK
ncbi:MAG: pilus assembly protein PilP [Bdellovibrionia bacterium]